MSERTEVSARTDRALLRHYGMNASIEHIEYGVDDYRTYAGKSVKKGVRAHDQHPADNVGRKRRANHGGIRQYKFYLKKIYILLRYRNLRKSAESGIDAIHWASACDKLLDQRPGLFYVLHRLKARAYLRAVSRYAYQTLQRKIFSIQYDFFQSTHSFSSIRLPAKQTTQNLTS